MDYLILNNAVTKKALRRDLARRSRATVHETNLALDCMI